MNITFLIGNGFDRNLGLATAYSDFVKYYKETEGKTDILKDFRNHIKANEELWSAAEIEIGKYTEEFETGEGAAFSECHNDFCEHLSEYLKKQEQRIDYDYVADEIEKAFSELIAVAKPFPTQEREVINQVFASHKAENTIYNFINYNYTSTLDKCVSQIKNKQKVLGTYRQGSTTYNHAIGTVQHVHGTVNGQMVFGVNDESQIAKPQIFECEYGDLYESALIKKQANDSYQENTDAKTKTILDGSHIVYIYGMSIGETDKLWWERVCAWLGGNGNRHLIVYRYSMPNRSLLETSYMIEERKARKEITKFAKLDEKQLAGIERRIHITNFNIFGSIKNIADKTKSTDELLIEAAREAVEFLDKGGRELLAAGAGVK